jgi:hypothetical protein
MYWSINQNSKEGYTWTDKIIIIGGPPPRLILGYSPNRYDTTLPLSCESHQSPPPRWDWNIAPGHQKGHRTVLGGLEDMPLPPYAINYNLAEVVSP